MAADGGLGTENDYSAVLAGGGGLVGSGFDHADYRDTRGGGDVVERKRGGGVAGYDEKIGAPAFEEVRGFDGVAGDGFDGFRAVGEAGSVSEVEVVGVGAEGDEFFENGEAAEAGVENADRGSGGSHWSSFMIAESAGGACGGGGSGGVLAGRKAFDRKGREERPLRTQRIPLRSSRSAGTAGRIGTRKCDAHHRLYDGRCNHEDCI